MYKYEVRIDNEGNDSLFCDSILTNKQIEKIISSERRKKYSIDDEFKMHRLPKTSAEWKEYVACMILLTEKCHNLKLQSISERTTWKRFQNMKHKDIITLIKEQNIHSTP